MNARLRREGVSMLAEPPPGDVVRLPDGRRLGFVERGDASGSPVFDFHGNPGSRLSFWGEEDSLRAAGVRLIGVDRPGIGLSDPEPGRDVAGWARDVAALAGALALERFAVLGHSVGGPYAAACAWALPERVTSAALVSSIIPLDSPGAFAELGKPRQWRMARDHPRVLAASLRALFTLARLAPGLAGRLFGARSTDVERAISARPEVVDRALASAAEATRQGAGGLVEDMRVAMRPWGFAPEEIRVPTFVWQGDADSSIPREWGEWWERAVPGARLVPCPGQGHLLIEERIEEILAALTREAVPAR